MVTVKQFLDAGFELVLGDLLFVNGDCCGKHEFNYGDVEYISMHKDHYYGYVIAELAWRKNTGAQPVGDDCLVEVKMKNGIFRTRKAIDFAWKEIWGITHWKPSIKHLEKQMNDNQEVKTALEMSERDVCNAVASELVNGDECVYVNDKDTIYTYVGMHPHGDGHYIFNDEKGITYVANGFIHEPETPEQKAARERMESAYDLYLECGMQTNSATFEEFKTWGSIDFWLSLVDNTGYRKQ